MYLLGIFSWINDQTKETKYMEIVIPFLFENMTFGIDNITFHDLYVPRDSLMTLGLKTFPGALIMDGRGRQFPSYTINDEASGQVK